MSYTEQDEKDEKTVGIDASWMRLRSLLDKGKRDAPIKLSGKETDVTTLMCYSSGEFVKMVEDSTRLTYVSSSLKEQLA